MTSDAAGGQTVIYEHRCECGYVASARTAAALRLMVADHEAAASSQAVADLTNQHPIDSPAAHRAMAPVNPTAIPLGAQRDDDKESTK